MKQFLYTATHNGTLTRQFVLRTPWLSIAFHWLNKPDDEDFVHDHGCNMFCVVLRGSYTEIIRHQDIFADNIINWWNYIPFYKAHRIESVEPGTLTLAFYGRPRGRWGFYTPSGWIDWASYNASRYDPAQSVPLPPDNPNRA